MKKIAKVFFILGLLMNGWCFSSCEENIEGPENNGGNQEPIVEGIVLYPSSSLIIADGKDELVFTVKYNGEDVTNSAYIYMNNKRMSENHFTTETTGAYKFFASYKGKVSKTIIVNAANPALYVELPEDSQADKFSNFERNILVAEGTGTWCGYCPYMIRALELFSEKGSNAEKAVIVAAHSGDEFSSVASEAAIKAMRITGFPSCVFNLNPEVLLENDYPDVNAEKINSMVGMELKEKACVGIAAATAVSTDETLTAVRSAIKVGQDGNYLINAWLIEDGVPAYQSSNWSEFSDGKATVLINHMHILRDASCSSPIQGKPLGEKEFCSKGEVYEFYHEFDVAKANVSNVKNCKIVVMVTTTSGTSSNYFVNNIIECPVGESVPFAYN